MGDSVYILFVDATVEISIVSDVARGLSDQEPAHICTNFRSATVGPLAARVVLVASKAERLDVATIAAATKWAAKGGTVVCLEPMSKVSLQARARMSGLVSTSAAAAMDVQAGQYQQVVGQVPDFGMGAKASIALPPVAPKAVWNLNVDADDGMLDEDDLLTAEDRVPVSAPSAADCSTAKKACKNCSCGRAEAEATGVKLDLTPEMMDNPQSACGSCGMGDAFRCSTCPYRGLPKFEAGKKIELSSDFLSVDA